MTVLREPHCAENQIAAGSYRRLRRGNSHGLRFTCGAATQPAFRAEMEEHKPEDTRGALATKYAGAVRAFDSAALFRHRLTSAEERCAEQSALQPVRELHALLWHSAILLSGEIAVPTVQVCGETKAQQRCAMRKRRK